MFQQITIIGRMGKDPETRSLANGNNVANFSLATSERWKDKQSGETKERTEWHNCVVFGKPADVVAEYVGKGDLLTVTGKLRTEEYEDKEGVNRRVTKIYVDRVVLMPKGTKGGEQAPARAPAARRAAAPRQQPEETVDSFDDDIPF